MGLGEFLSLLCALLWAFAVILYRKAGETLDVWEMNLFKSALVLVLMVPTVIFFNGLAVPDFGTKNFLIIFISGVIGIMLADLLYLRALQIIGAGLTGITGSLYSPFVVLLSFFYLGELLNHWQYFGMLIVLAGVLIAGYKKKTADNLNHAPAIGFVYAALGVFFTALGIVIIKPLTHEYPFFWIILVRSLGGFLSMFLFCILFSKSINFIKTLRLKGSQNLIWGTIFGQYLSMMIWVAGYKYTSASVASILNETASIFILLLSWIFLKEELSRKKIIGIIITVVGVFIVLNTGSH